MENLTKDQIVEALKKPEVRAKLKEVIDNPAGANFAEMTDAELSEVHGASDVKPETTPFCVGVIVGLTTSIKICK